MSVGFVTSIVVGIVTSSFCHTSMVESHSGEFAFASAELLPLQWHVGSACEQIQNRVGFGIDQLLFCSFALRRACQRPLRASPHASSGRQKQDGLVLAPVDDR